MEKNQIAKSKIMEMWKNKVSYYTIKDTIQNMRNNSEVTLKAYIQLNKINEGYRLFN